MPTLNRRQARVAIAALEPFKGSNVSGHEPSGWLGTGRLNEAEWAILKGAMDSGQLAYVVKSYDTPIAWYRRDTGWYRVSQKFSQTTSCHIGLVPVTGTMAGALV